jgi:hypothetical protein
MYISLMNRLSTGFKKRSVSQDDNDDEARGGTPIPIADPPVDHPAATPVQPHHPWLVQGAGSSF